MTMQNFIVDPDCQFAEHHRANQEYHFNNEESPWTSLRKNSRDCEENSHAKRDPNNRVPNLRVFVFSHRSSPRAGPSCDC